MSGGQRPGATYSEVHAVRDVLEVSLQGGQEAHVVLGLHEDPDQVRAHVFKVFFHHRIGLKPFLYLVQDTLFFFFFFFCLFVC